MESLLPFHVQRIKEEYSLRAARNNSYSLRSFARDMGICAATLSGLLRLNKGLSEGKAKQLVEILELSKSEAELFLLSVKAAHARSPGDRARANLQIENNKKVLARRKKIEPDNFARIQNWYCLSMLELMELDSCQHTVEWFAKKLKLNPIVIKSALAALQEAGLVEYRDQRYWPLSSESTTQEDVPSKEIKTFHAEMLKKSEEALFLEPTQAREFINMTLSFPTSEITEAKEFIRDFQQKFAERFYHQTKRKRNSVYQLSVQFFRLDQKEK